MSNIIDRTEALNIAKPYVEFIDNFGNVDLVLDNFKKLKRGQAVIAYRDGEFRRAKVTSIKHDDYRAIDGPLVRVSDGEYSWRVDGSKYAYPI